MTSFADGTILTAAQLNSAFGAKLDLLGGTISGTITMPQNGGGTATQPVALTISRTAGTKADADLVDIAQTVTYAGGSGLAQALQVQSTVGNTGTGSSMDGPGVNVWNMNARLYSSALKYSAAGPVDSQHVSLQARAERSLPTGGVPAGKQMAEIWSLYVPTVDHTQLATTVAGPLNGIELDLGANNLDDAMARQGIQVIVGPDTALANGGLPAEVSRLVTFSGHAAPSGQIDGFCKFGIWAGMPYSISLFDSRIGNRMDTTVATTLSAPGTTIAVANVWGFTSAGALGAPVSASNPATITINGNQYTQTGFTTTAGSTAGTITLSSNVSVADGTSGNVVSPNGHTIWLGTGQDIALTTDGLTRFYVDGSGHFTFQGSTGKYAQIMSQGIVTGAGTFSAGITATGTSTFVSGPVTFTDSGGDPGFTLTSSATNASMEIGHTNRASTPFIDFHSGATFNDYDVRLIASGGTASSGGGTLTLYAGQININSPVVVNAVLTIGRYTVAGLPASPTPGMVAFASDGRNSGEAAAAGTGCQVYANSAHVWIAAWSGVAVTA